MFRFFAAARAGAALILVLILVLALAGCQKRPPSPSVAEDAAVPAASAPADRLASAKKAFAAGNCAQALPDLAEAAKAAPQAAEARLYLGLCAARQHDPARAEAELRQAAAADPRDPRPLEALGLLQYEGGDRDAARRTLAGAADRGSASAQVFYYRGNLAMFARDCREGLAHYRRAMVLDPSFAPAAAEYRAARLACARAEAAAAPPPPPAPKPAPKPKPKPAPAPAAASDSGPAPASGPATP